MIPINSKLDRPFCQLRERIIHENDSAVVILSNPRLVPGHALVIPKRHVEIPWELTSQEQQAIFSLILSLQKMVTARIAAGCDISQHYRPFISESRLKVNHLHYHVVPRDFQDEIYTRVQYNEADLFANLSDEEQTKINRCYDYL